MECAKCGVKCLELNEYDLCSCCYAEEMEKKEEYDMEGLDGRGD